MMLRKYKRHFDFDDMFQDGFIGLMDAMLKFKSGMGARFKSYAAHRVRGAILDGIRSRQYGSRDHPQDNNMVSFDDPRRPITIKASSDPDSFIYRSERIIGLIDRIERCLNLREQYIIALIFFEGWGEIRTARYLCLSQSRVSQIVRNSIVKLRRSYGIGPKYRMEPDMP